MSNLSKVYESVTDGDVSWLLRKAFWAGHLVGRFSNELEVFYATQPDVRLQIDDDGIQLQHPASREQASDFLKAFGGTWAKELSIYDDKIDYFREITLEGRKFTLAVRYSAPPPSCKIVEEVVEVPATTKTVKRIVCPEPHEAEQPAEPVNDLPLEA